MRRGDKAYFRLGDYVIMPNHVHTLLQVLVGHELSEIIKAWKSASARMMGQHLGRSGSYWMDEYFDHAVRQERSLREFVRYIRQNPRNLPADAFAVGCGSLSAAGVRTGGESKSAAGDTGGTVEET